MYGPFIYPQYLCADMYNGWAPSYMGCHWADCAAGTCSGGFVAAGGCSGVVSREYLSITMTY